jgi:hypothetical protein
VSLGPAEILVLLVVMLVFVGPRRRSDAVRYPGRAWRAPVCSRRKRTPADGDEVSRLGVSAAPAGSA